jgi:hypothetical protein
MQEDDPHSEGQDIEVWARQLAGKAGGRVSWPAWLAMMCPPT